VRCRPRIYQLLPRLFGNTNETRVRGGSIRENGVGKFADISETALTALRDELAITHVWLTGVLAQATETDYAEIGKAADDPALLKGRAGSPFAIKDYADVCPDYANVPANRLLEFRELVERAHALGLGVIIDFVPNHVARSHYSTVFGFGADDDRTKFFAPNNNFFWIQPDGSERVAGNNAARWPFGESDWYETAKLNYGFDFATGQKAYDPIPDTWLKMDRVLAYWQQQGVDGFRCDMAHMVPLEFWRWAVARARVRQRNVMFIAEAYENDPMKVPSSDGERNVSVGLLDAGFDAVYDDPSYKTLKRIYDGPGWANDLDAVFADERIFHASLRYAENHDEVRIASRRNWGGHGAQVGIAISAILLGLGRGPAMIYCGQEVGEPADGSEGFSPDDGRTTIFDYWSMPEFTKWVNHGRFDGGGLSPAQRAIRAHYGKLLRLFGEPAFSMGDCFFLNRVNLKNARFGRLPGETVSGHWLYAFARREAESGQCFFVVVNLHPQETLHSVRLFLETDLVREFGLIESSAVDRFGTTSGRVTPLGFEISEIPPLTPAIFEILNNKI
jgi:glycosidase